MRNLGLDVRRCTPTGIIGVLKGNQSGKTVMLRCDIDALPVTEETKLDFISENDGVMHACGHDGHTAMLLIAAKILAQHKDEIKGNVVFLFQPNEEGAGAEDMVKQGALENPKPDAVFGLHIWSPVEVGKIGIIPDLLWPRAITLKLRYMERVDMAGHRTQLSIPSLQPVIF